jgi:hypothetical protein
MAELFKNPSMTRRIFLQPSGRMSTCETSMGESFWFRNSQVGTAFWDSRWAKKSRFQFPPVPRNFFCADQMRS